VLEQYSLQGSFTARAEDDRRADWALGLWLYPFPPPEPGTLSIAGRRPIRAALSMPGLAPGRGALFVGSGSMSLTIRPARRGDGAGIAGVWLSAAAYYADLDPAHFQLPQADGLAEEWDGQLGQDCEDTLRLVAEAEGRVVGWLSARIEPPEDTAAVQLTREHGWTRLAVDALLVDRRWWRHGAGTALLGAAETWGYDQGARVARLDTYAHSPVSVPFYEQRMGYQRRSIIFQKDL
jgi:GNAT superfamily N-acetyltransferase